MNNFIKEAASELGFSSCGFTNLELAEFQQYYQNFLDNNYCASMTYLENHQYLKFHPQELLANAKNAIVLTLDYFDGDKENLNIKQQNAYVANYAKSKDYHKYTRKLATKLIEKIKEKEKNLIARAFVDSAPVLERSLALKANLGFIGKNTMLMNNKQGSLFFICVIFVNLDLETSLTRQINRCGSCTKCLDFCPTNAFVKPFVLDASKCISYLTIENNEDIAIQFRKAIGNRIFGCDECLRVCPFNKFAQKSLHTIFLNKHQLMHQDLYYLLELTEQEFLEKSAGTPLRRMKYRSFLRNVIIALGNNQGDKQEIIKKLTSKLANDEFLDEYILWAINEQETRT